MAITYGLPQAEASGSGSSSSHDPILDKLARTNRFDSDWPTLRHHLHLALQSSLQVFLDKGPPRSAVRPASPAVPGPVIPTSPADRSDDKPPPESLLLSPSTQSTPLETSITPGNPTGLEPRSVDAEPRDSPAPVLESEHDNPELLASTQGGLVIPPFPPLDTNKRRRGPLGGPTGGPGGKVNGHGSANGPNGSFGRGQMGLGEDEWDEDILIGGKKLPGWLDEEEGRREIERVDRILEDMDVAPFTIQRIAELLLNPTAMHSSLGKFLRALEKALLVTTPWEPPSYVYVPPTTTTGAGMFSARSTSSTSSATSSASSASSDAGSDEESLMPPGASTPMFSPIPFLRRPGTEAGDPMPMDLDATDGESGQGTNGRSLEEGLMSPLALGDSPAGGEENMSEPFRFADAPSVRSPTPEPDEPVSSSSPVKTKSDSPTSPISPTTPSASRTPVTPPTAVVNEQTTPSDPAHQSYLGRVDELDTGPLNTPPPARGDGTEPREDEIMTPGAGEGGNMTPHGMSDKPVPISSTTVVGEEERKIAGMPRMGSAEKDQKDAQGGDAK